ncbi:hypothetical protein BC939DRAFT_448411 [Gamsiella multidivaricata]|uniref:uncharacterized protein n=1 Tax=Gamsiella multidivaricata TaxID=101098 RepID=UPI002220CB46|nr:uncharacterized protein BC939DRAFT_448411 [Gamsiella multidivaricata]KAI7825277.1 hypothetical protein BC939DRAFT_448411 [Gamsiella multidivaricata]
MDWFRSHISSFGRFFALFCSPSFSSSLILSFYLSSHCLLVHSLPPSASASASRHQQHPNLPLMSSNLCQQSQAHRLYSLYLHYDASHTAKHEDPECKAVLQHCFALLEKDYVVGAVPNHNGQLCSSYPSELAILEKPRDLSHQSSAAVTGTRGGIQNQEEREYLSRETLSRTAKEHQDQASASVSKPSPAPFQNQLLPALHSTSSSPSAPSSQSIFLRGPSNAPSSSASLLFSQAQIGSNYTNVINGSIVGQQSSSDGGNDNGLPHEMTNQQYMDHSLIDEAADQSFDLGESGMMSFQDIKTELDMIHPPQPLRQQQHQHQQQEDQGLSNVSDQDRSRRHILPFPFRIPRPEKKMNVAIKEYEAPPSIPHTKRTQESVQSAVDKDKVNDTLELSKQFEKSHFARVRARFVVPCILVRGKNICRSATLSNEVEVFMHSVNQKINDLNQKRKMFLYGTGERSPDKEDRESSLEKQRMEDIELLHQLGVTYINDLMVENRKVKYGLKVTSSEKVDSFGRYSKFKLVATPYPGVEFFQKFKANKYSARKLCFDWSQTFADAELQLPTGHIDHLSIRWRDYKSWDLIELTQNYLRLYLTHIADDTPDQDMLGTIGSASNTPALSPKGLLIHCISGWDRTPLFISLLRISLWADGEAHQSLTAAEMLYLTMGYDWFLFNHLLADRSQRGEDIFYFCFYFLKFIYDEEFSLNSISNLSKKAKSPSQPTSQQVLSRSPMLKNIGRLKGLGDFSTSAGSDADDAHGFVCEDCKLLRKSNEPLGRDMTSAKNNSQEAATSTDGKASSWQLVTFSTPPGRDKHGSPRAPFAPTLQSMTRASGSPLGAKRNSYSTGFSENDRGATEQGVLDSDPREATSPLGLADGRCRLGVQQFIARRSSSSSIPDLFADESKHLTQGIVAPEFTRVATFPNLAGSQGTEEIEEADDDGKGELARERQATPRKRASTFDGGLLLTGEPDSHVDAGDRDPKEQEEEEDLTSDDDDNGEDELGRDVSDGAVSRREEAGPQICQVCHHSFFAGSNQLIDQTNPTGNSSTALRRPIPVNADALSHSQQRPLGFSAEQVSGRMRVVDRLFSQDDVERICHHGQQVNESDRDEGMFQLEIEDRPTYQPILFSCDERSELNCLNPPCHSSSGYQEGSLGSSSCIDRDRSVRDMSSAADEIGSIEGDENESFWDETSTIDYGYSPGSVLNGFGLGLTKCPPDRDDNLGLDAGRDIARRGEDCTPDEDDDEDDDDEDCAASLNSRQGGLQIDRHENDHLFMPSLKGVFSAADKSSQGRGRRRNEPHHNSYASENMPDHFVADPAHPSDKSAEREGANINFDQSQTANSEAPRALTRRQKLRQLRRLFMDMRDEIGDGNRSPSRPVMDVKNTMVSMNSATEDDDDSGSSFRAESFSDDTSFQYRSSIATSATFVSRHGLGSATSSSTPINRNHEFGMSQPFFSRGSSSRQSGESFIVSPVARLQQHQQQHQQQRQSQGPGLTAPSGNGRKSPFEWAAAAASSAAASISSASGIVSGGFGHSSVSSAGTTLSPTIKPSMYHTQQQQQRQQRQHSIGSGHGSAGSMQSPVSSTTMPTEDFLELSSSTTMLNIHGERSSDRVIANARRRSLATSPMVISPTSSASNPRMRGVAADPGHIKEKGGENSGRWDWVQGIFV